MCPLQTSYVATIIDVVIFCGFIVWLLILKNNCKKLTHRIEIIENKLNIKD